MRQSFHEETCARLAARASELRVRSKSWRAWCKPRRPTPALPAPSRAIGCRQLKESSRTVRCPSRPRRAVTRSRGPTRRA
eukprot:845161-Pleurochrysis_carterae.AAC.1